jgi:predicted nucleic acid-binding protein
MVLVDTSIWVDHFRQGNIALGSLLQEGMVVCHPFIIGELACGNLKNRGEILAHLQALPEAAKAEDREVLRFLEDQGLMGKGLGFIDMHLLASALLSKVSLWTLDKKLHGVAQALHLVPDRIDVRSLVKPA